MAEAATLGIYVSVPFCRAKCSFCNFASGVGTAIGIEAYLDRLLEEIYTSRAFAQQRGLKLPEVVDSVYLGGGTPSLLQPVQMMKFFTNLREVFDLAADAEVTLEAAPGQIEDELLEVALAHGVNRVSLGVQSFVDREAQAVGRSHTGQSCLAEIRRLHRAGLDNVGIDLICGLPHQTAASFHESLTMACDSGAQHVSVYMLEVDEKSRLGREVLGGGARLHAPAMPNEDLVLRLYEAACDRLPVHGLEQYEISNFAEAGHRSQHNLKYWMRSPYLGFGLDAHSMLLAEAPGLGCSVRWQNTSDLAVYSNGADHPEAECGTARDAFEEEVFLGLRLTEGLADERLAWYPSAWTEALHRLAEPLAEAGLMKRNGAAWRLTAAGRVVSGEIFGELLCAEPVLA